MISKTLDMVRGQTHHLPYPVRYWLRYAADHAQIRLKPTPGRLGPVFERHYAFQAESQWWDRERLLQYQAEQVRDLVRHAYAHVPFHRRRFDEHGVRPEDIRSADLLRRLPTMSKDDLRQHIDDLLATDRPRERLQRVTTGGTGGRPVAFFLDEDTYTVTLAYEWRQMNFAGHRFGECIAILRGSRTLRPVRGGRATWEYKPIDNALLLSSFDLTPENMAEYCKQLERFRPTLFAGYPSSLDLLARFMLDRGVAGPRQLRAILTSSENLFRSACAD